MCYAGERTMIIMNDDEDINLHAPCAFVDQFQSGGGGVRLNYNKYPDHIKIRN